MCVPPIFARQKLGIMYPSFVARQWFCKHVPAAKNTRNSRGIVGCVVSMRSFGIEGKQVISSSQNF
jgi:hypothetical protein